ncbi:hypothetical protein RJ639_040945 [Escallonia herrerae]|uniref:Uncharacterized protein n=1 Tax=Escallonia herrerae TaxID=1293975 RepID=A0AA88WDY9_9ASTE|nr:hypothetical protein RJ639_040945 [Escallonia herrerae]
MRVYSSLWNADDWATQGWQVKTDWTKAPFTAFYKNYNANGCVKSSTGSSRASGNSVNDQAWQTQELDSAGRNNLRWVQSKSPCHKACLAHLMDDS